MFSHRPYLDTSLDSLTAASTKMILLSHHERVPLKMGRLRGELRHVPALKEHAEVPTPIGSGAAAPQRPIAPHTVAQKLP